MNTPMGARLFQDIPRHVAKKIGDVEKSVIFGGRKKEEKEHDQNITVSRYHERL